MTRRFRIGSERGSFEKVEGSTSMRVSDDSMTCQRRVDFVDRVHEYKRITLTVMLQTPCPLLPSRSHTPLLFQNLRPPIFPFRITHSHQTYLYIYPQSQKKPKIIIQLAVIHVT